MFELLESFPNRKIVLTNASKERIEESDFAEVPYEIFTLLNDPSKTDPEYFHKLLTHLMLEVGDVVYFDHNPEAVKSAESVGIKTYHFDSEKRDIESLLNFLEENV